MKCTQFNRTSSSCDVTFTLAELVRPCVSAQVMVIVCVPGPRAALIDAPTPSAPSMLELHSMKKERSSSCGSKALPEKSTDVPRATLAPDAGMEGRVALLFG